MLMLMLLVNWIMMISMYWDKFFLLLIMMEGAMLILFSSMFMFNSMMSFSFEVIFLFLSMMIIEGTMGLVMLISMSFKYGNDKFSMNSFF